ncbi:hypothetical protein [Rudaea cellulosilytica]|uniref:hypothetical protein n=1 Tax=Rudaea cellulosilytica TaxID=540746 RepID=UPI0003632CE0|nr:hypothetical protein [Rudaea cellulosilytica]
MLLQFESNPSWAILLDAGVAPHLKPAAIDSTMDETGDAHVDLGLDVHAHHTVARRAYGSM